jgi:hypothetical protein
MLGVMNIRIRVFQKFAAARQILNHSCAIVLANSQGGSHFPACNARFAAASSFNFS